MPMKKIVLFCDFNAFRKTPREQAINEYCYILLTYSQYQCDVIYNGDKLMLKCMKLKCQNKHLSSLFHTLRAK